MECTEQMQIPLRDYSKIHVRDVQHRRWAGGTQVTSRHVSEGCPARLAKNAHVVRTVKEKTAAYALVAGHEELATGLYKART